ncbi:MAG TPA: flippase [Longimicrobiales bacterium]
MQGRVIARNTLFNLLGLGLPLVVALVAVPVILDGMGPERFGLLGLVWVALGYLQLLDLGLGRAVTRHAARAMEAREPHVLAAVVRATSVAQVVLGVLGGALLALLAPALAGRWLEISPALVGEATRSFMLLGVAAPLLLLANTYRGVLEAGQRFDVVNAVRLPASLLNYAVPMAGALYGWSLPFIVGVILAGRVLMLVGYVIAARRLWPAPAPLEVSARDLLPQLVGYGGWVTVSSLISPLLVYLDRFVIGLVASVTAVGYYTAPHEMVTRLSILPSSLAATLFPAFAVVDAGRADDQTRRAQAERLAVRAVKYLLVATLPLLVVLFALADELLRAWLGSDFAANAALPLRVLAVGMAFNAIAYVPHSMLQATGRPDVTAKIHMLELPLHVAALWLLVGRWNVAGAALAWSARAALDAMLLFAAAARLRLLSPGALFGQRLPLVLMAALGFALALLAVAARAQELADAVLPATLLVAAWMLGAWRFALDGTERSQLTGVLARRRAGVVQP